MPTTHSRAGVASMCAAALAFSGLVVTGMLAAQPAAAADPAGYQNVRINEVTSSGNDTVELYNTGTSAVSIGSGKYVDGDTGHSAAKISSSSPSATSIPAGGYVTFDSTIGLGDNDSAFLLDSSGNTVDSVTWATDGAKPSDERCVNGTGGFRTATTATLGSANSCSGSGGGTTGGTTGGTDGGTGTTGGTGGQPGRLLGGGGPLTSGCTPEAPSGTHSTPSGTLAWPGGQDVTIADDVCAFTTSTGPEGRDVSGLAFDPANPSVLWAVKNKNWLYKLVKSNGIWIPDSSWSAKGKQIRFSGGSGEPDSEGVTVGGNGHLYVTSERDNTENTAPKDTVLEFDPAATGSTLSPLHQWDMTSQFPQLDTGDKGDANLGFEGVGYVPDSWLTAGGWTDPLTGAAYDPADYPLHGSGLFFAGLEWDGTLHVYGLNSNGTFTTFGTVATGKSSVMDVTFDAATQRLVASCDNTCGETHTFMKVGSNGTIVPDVTYTNPAVMPTDNLEGFALAPASTCVAGAREAVWSDDGFYGFGSNTSSSGHALYSGTFPC